MKIADKSVYVDFDDLMFILAASAPFFVALSFLNHWKVSSPDISAIFVIFLSTYTIWFFHIVLKSKGYGLGSWFRMQTFGPDLIWSIIMFPAIFGVYAVISYVMSYLWGTASIFPKVTMNPHPLLAVISLGLFAPVLQEVIFRGAVFGYLEKFFSSEFSMILTSVAFAVVHPVADWTQSFVLGMLLNLLYYKRRALTVPAAIHVMVSLISLSITYLSGS